MDSVSVHFIGSNANLKPGNIMNTKINNTFSAINMLLNQQVGEKQATPAQGTRISDSSLSNLITQNLAGNVKTSNTDIASAVHSPEFSQLVNNAIQVLDDALASQNDSDNITFVLPKSSQQANLICMLIEIANEASISDIELSSTFGVMSENSSMSAAQAQQAQGMAIFSKSLVSSSINMASTGYATHSAVKNYSATKVNLSQNQKSMLEYDHQVRKMQNALDASKKNPVELVDLSSPSRALSKVDGSKVDLQQHDRVLSAEHHAVASRNLDEMVMKRDAFNRAFLQGEARTRLTASQIEAQRAIGTIGSNIADGTGTLAHNIEQKEETEERSEAKVMDGAVEMSRQQAQKSQQLLSNMMNLLNETRRTSADLVSSFSSNMKA